MLCQHYHTADSEEDSEVQELEVYWNNQSNIVIRETQDNDYLQSVIVLTPEMAKYIINVLNDMIEGGLLAK